MPNIWIYIHVGEIYSDDYYNRIEDPDYSQRIELAFTRELDGNTIIMFRSDLHKMIDSALNKIQSDMEQRFRETKRNIHITQEPDRISKDDAIKIAEYLGGSRQEGQEDEKET